jgi:hypothetical protein
VNAFARTLAEVPAEETAYPFLSTFDVALKAIFDRDLSHNNVTALIPAADSSLDAAALKTILPAGVIDTVGSSTLVVSR